MPNHWDYYNTDEPQAEELNLWQSMYDPSDQLAIRHECPYCGSHKTQWMRNEWHMCFNCLIPFTTAQAMDYLKFITEEI